MAPRGAARRKDAHSEDYRELGVVGRKTGIGLPDLGARDEHGMAPIDGLFSSPEKGTPLPGDDRTQGAMDMDLESDAGPGPLSVLKAYKLPPRGISPRKTNMQSPAIRNPHLGRSSSPVRGSTIESDPPSQKKGSVVRKLNYGSSQTNGMRGNPGRVNGIKANSRRPVIDEEDEEDEEEAILHGRSGSPGVNGGADDSLQMVGGDADDVDPVSEEDVDVDESIIERAVEAAKPKQIRRPGRPKKVPDTDPEPEPEPESEAEPEPEPEPESETESEPEPFRDEADVEDENDFESREATPEPGPVPTRKRGRPPKNQSKSDDSITQKKPGKRGRPPRSSLEQVPEQPEPVEDEDEDDQEPPSPKRARTAEKPTKPGRGRPKATPANADPTTETISEPSKAKKKAKAPTPVAAPAKKKGRSRKSNVGEDSVLEKVQKGPPLPKSRGLYSVKRQDPDAIITTRSGRHSYAPLHYWRNERVLYNDENDVWNDGISSRAKQDRFILPSTKGVVRVDEEPYEPKRKRTNKVGQPANVKREAVDDAEPPEPWEVEEGRVEGETIVWDPDYEYNPPAPNEPVSFEVNEIAVSANAIETRDVRDATFRFTKVLSLPFFGAGIVDLPPGAEKKPKNSRKNHMTFFVHYGKVLVTVNETEFRISAGGFWNVPRGNYYNILNDYEKPARLFFTQGSEVMISEPEGRSIVSAEQ